MNVVFRYKSDTHKVSNDFPFSVLLPQAPRSFCWLQYMQLFKTKLKHWVFTILEQSTALTFFQIP